MTGPTSASDPHKSEMREPAGEALSPNPGYVYNKRRRGCNRPFGRARSGSLVLYGLQRMPVTLYVEQWERLLSFADEIRKFMTEHDAELKRKQPQT